MRHCISQVLIFSLSLTVILVFSLLLTTNVESLTFNYPHFSPTEPNMANIICANDSYVTKGTIELTATQYGVFFNSVGRISYYQPLHLWDNITKEVTNFTTHFLFNIAKAYQSHYGDGFTFFLAPFDEATAYAPPYSSGGQLGLISVTDTTQTRSTSDKQPYPFVAVEFDTFQNVWDIEVGPHLGIDVNSVTSEVTSQWKGLDNWKTANAQITYDSSTHNLSVILAYDDLNVSTLSYLIDLSKYLPDRVRIGFSAATSSNVELHNILSWDFSSTLGDDVFNAPPSPANNNVPHTPPPPPPPPPTRKNQGKRSKVALVGGLLAIIGVLTIGVGSVGFMWWKKSSRLRGTSSSNTDDFNVNDDFYKGTGPRRFTYDELSCATKNFAEEGKLEEGSFGSVYMGFLTGPYQEIAVKKVSRRSSQGIKEYMSEVKIISRLRHRNLVQLLGWCHERGELLLVYEFMANGSLYSHLYSKGVILQWTVRYKIVQGLASALFYLQEGWEQCVLHRDIKPSNIMLDSNFNAKLGDFGLARLVDHHITAQTTLLAGTLAYLSPEIVSTGKARRESDIYSLGVVALELGCGRPPVDLEEEPNKVTMVEWVWKLYGKGHLLEAADRRLAGAFDIQQFKCLMVVGLWCCHPDYTCRPSIGQVLNALNMESPLPKLPSKLPVLVYFCATANDATISSSRTDVRVSQSAHESSENVYV